MGPNARERQELEDTDALLEMDVDQWGEGQEEFLTDWFYALGRGERQSWNHRGALAHRHPTDPRHWDDPNTGQWYFDPSNYIYKEALHRACPGVLRKCGVTDQDKCGDLIESLSGYCWDIRNNHTAEEAEAILQAPIHGSAVSLYDAEHFWQVIVYHCYRMDWLSSIGK
jgi:hypothetical protein